MVDEEVSLDVDVEDVDDDELDEPDEFVDEDEPPLRKSVAYQPVPLSWNPAAVNCLRNDGLPQDSHTVSGASETFCSTSLEKPHSSQR